MTSPAATTNAAVATSTAPAVPTVPADVPLTGHNMLAGEKPPVEPAAALAHTSDGAIAFAEFWIQTLDWSYATTSTTYPRHYTDPGCDVCSQMLAKIDSFAVKGDYYVGGRITILSAALGHSAPENGSEYSVVTLTNVNAGAVLDAQHISLGAEPAVDNRPLQTWLAWKSNAWTVTAFGAA